MKYLLMLLCLCSLMACHRNKPTEEVNWVLKRKIFYTYTFNKEGRVDTTYLKTVTFENALPKDSTFSGIAFTYKDANPYKSTEFRKVGNKFVVQSNTTNEFNELGLLAQHTAQKGDSVIEQKRMEYDSVHRLILETDIRLHRGDTSENDFANAIGSTVEKGYDTTVLHFTYTKTALTAKIDVTDPRGKLLYSIVNIYSGPEPVSTYRLSGTGDTLETTRYSKQNKALKSVITGKTFNASEIRYKGKLMAAIFENLKTGQKNRTVNRYTARGMVFEQDFYSAQ